jgi:prefoldin alpha subunit
MNQEQIMQFQMLEQEANQLNQQLQMIDGNLKEIIEIKNGLDEIEKKDTKEILANIGKKIFIPVEIKEKSLIIEVGNKKFVKKSIPETKVLIVEQIEKLNSAKSEITQRLDVLQEEATRLMMAIENIEEDEKSPEHDHKHKHKHNHDENCECEDDCGDECKCDKK